MGYFSEYLNKAMDPEALSQERKKQLGRISALRGGRDVLVYAADLRKGGLNVPISIDYSDLLPISDQIANLSGSAIDLIIETPGGDGPVAEDIVKLLRGRYSELAVIVPGYAKSAGTIMAMAADEILMGPASALGPIDAQIFWQGKVFSAEALLEGFEKIKDEVVASNGVLNKAYIPILQNISPGELQNARNLLDFATNLVTEWLVKYKFKDWKTHSHSGQPVTDDERTERAAGVAKELRSHSKWLTHSRSLRIDDLRAMRLLITDYSEEPDLSDAISRYHTLLQMTFDSPVYKVIETPVAQIFRIGAAVGNLPPNGSLPSDANMLLLQGQCTQCGQKLELQANVGVHVPLQPGKLPFPADNKLTCPTCGTQNDLSPLRQQIESKTGKKIVP